MSSTSASKASSRRVMTWDKYLSIWRDQLLESSDRVMANQRDYEQLDPGHISSTRQAMMADLVKRSGGLLPAAQVAQKPTAFSFQSIHQTSGSLRPLCNSIFDELFQASSSSSQQSRITTVNSLSALVDSVAYLKTILQEVRQSTLHHSSVGIKDFIDINEELEVLEAWQFCWVQLEAAIRRGESKLSSETDADQRSGEAFLKAYMKQGKDKLLAVIKTAQDNILPVEETWTSPMSASAQLKDDLTAYCDFSAEALEETRKLQQSLLEAGTDGSRLTLNLAEARAGVELSAAYVRAIVQGLLPDTRAGYGSWLMSELSSIWSRSTKGW